MQKNTVVMILSDILPYLGYEPKYSAEQMQSMAISVPNVVDKTVSEAKSALVSAGLNYRIIGSGEKIIKQLPTATQTIYKNGIVILYTDEKSDSKAEVPKLTGMTISQVNSTATNAGFNVSFKGNTLTSSAVVSYSQSIEAGTKAEKGTVIEVYFRSQETGDIGLVN